MKTRVSLITVAAAAFLGCGGDDDATPIDAGVTPDALVGGPVEPFPDKFCPGQPTCTGEGDGAFRVGAARATIAPTLVETEWTDDNENNHYNSGEPYVDANGNGEFDPFWLAGFGTGRPATGVNDGIWARAIVFDYNDIRVGLVVVDTVGWFISDIEPSLEAMPASLDLDHVIVASTHTHEAIDTIGKWGRSDLVTGIDPDYIDLVRAATVDAVTAGVAGLEPVTMSVAQAMTVDDTGSSLQFVGDRRDPVVLDPTVTVLRFAATAEPARTVATLVHWSAHPEYAGSRNNLISSDYPHWIREVLEHGAPETASEPALEGLGGEVVFLNGAIGGQIGDNRVQPIDPDGVPILSDGLHKSERVGTTVGRIALTAITSVDATDVPTPTVSFRSGQLWLVVENVFFHVAGLVGIFNRPFFGYDETKSIDAGNYPYLPSRVTYLQVGNVGIATAPGELDPSLVIGGFDGSQAWGDDFIDPDNEDPPVLANAPQPPYLRDLILANDGVQIGLVAGMAEDYLGYIVPSWNYVLDASNPYIEEHNGSQHYEETLSLSPFIEAEAVGSMRAIINWRPDASKSE